MVLTIGHTNPYQSQPKHQKLIYGRHKHQYPPIPNRTTYISMGLGQGNPECTLRIQRVTSGILVPEARCRITQLLPTTRNEVQRIFTTKPAPTIQLAFLE